MNESEKMLNLKSDLVDRIKNITNDCRTFLWLRTVNPKVLNDEKNRIGGGNLSIALAVFSGINYLANSYHCLTADIKSFQYKPKGIYYPDGKKNFLFFVKNQRSNIDLGVEGLTEDELSNIWDDWRNKLTHFCTVRYGNTSLSFMELDDIHGLEKFLTFIKKDISKIPSFIKTASGWNLKIDLMSFKLDGLATYIAEKVLLEATKENIDVFEKWLEHNLYPREE